jgi:hypothetical protein
VVYTATKVGAIDLINPAGAIAGWYTDQSNVNHSNMPAGAIAGAYIDSNDVVHGFLRTP